MSRCMQLQNTFASQICDSTNLYGVREVAYFVKVNSSVQAWHVSFSRAMCKQLLGITFCYIQWIRMTQGKVREKRGRVQTNETVKVMAKVERTWTEILCSQGVWKNKVCPLRFFLGSLHFRWVTGMLLIGFNRNLFVKFIPHQYRSSIFTIRAELCLSVKVLWTVPDNDGTLGVQF